MTHETLQTILSIGETVSVEFKRGGNGAEADTFETICAFLNRFGGDVFLGVLNDGTIVGVPPAAAPQIANHIVNVAGDPGVFQPAVYLAPEIIQWEGRTIVHVHVPNSGEVHSYKRVVYDRAGDADVKVKATGQIAMMYIRKQNFYTEQRIYPFVGKEDLRLDLLPVVRQMAQNRRKEGHPWYKLADDDLFKSAGLVGLDRDSGKRGFNLAAILLLGRDETIRDVCPAYMTDALWRVRNLDRYDDREVVRTNLIESYEQLMEFGRKHLPDPFFLEGSIRISLREILTREMVANVLIHREFVSPKPARFVIERDRMFTENTCRSARAGAISPENLEPEAKNPIIAAFFREIGLADQLGSGVRNLYKYARAYGGADPEIVENDTFRISVNIPDEASELLVSSDQKVVADGEKLVSTSKKLVFDGKKLVFDGRALQTPHLSRPTLEKITVLYSAGMDTFGIQETAALFHTSRSGAIRLLRLLREAGLIMLAPSSKRGKYRFVLD